VAVSPDGESVYVADFGYTPADTVAQYDVGPGGKLSPKTPAAVAAGVLAQDLAVSPDGKNVYVANAGTTDNGTISQYDVGPGGALSPKSPPFVRVYQPHRLAVSPDSQNVYVTGDLGLSHYHADSGGALSLMDQAFVGNPGGVEVSPDGKSVYATTYDSETDGSVSQFDVGSGGTLSPKSPPTLAARDGAIGMAVSPDGESLYVTNQNSNNVSQYDVSAGGNLSPKNPATVAAGRGPTAVAVSPLARVPTTKEQCKHGGWRQFGFKNQGQCIRFVKHGPKK
jgi:DNA-binding beta-propeller fold protein YncE